MRIQSKDCPNMEKGRGEKLGKVGGEQKKSMTKKPSVLDSFCQLQIIEVFIQEAGSVCLKLVDKIV